MNLPKCIKKVIIGPQPLNLPQPLSMAVYSMALREVVVPWVHFKSSPSHLPPMNYHFFLGGVLFPMSKQTLLDQFWKSPYLEQG